MRLVQGWFFGDIIFLSNLNNMTKRQFEWDPIEDPAMSDLRKGLDPSQEAAQQLRVLEDLLSPSLQKEYGRMEPLSPDDGHRIVFDIRKLIAVLSEYEREPLERELKRLEEQVDLQYAPFFAREVEIVGSALASGRRPFSDPDNVRTELENAIDVLVKRADQKAQEAIFVLKQNQKLLEMYLKEPLFFTYKWKADNLREELKEREVWEHRNVDDLEKGLPSPAQTPILDVDQEFLVESRVVLDELTDLESKMKDAEVLKFAKEYCSEVKAGVEIYAFRIDAPVMYLRLLAESREILEGAKGHQLDSDAVRDFTNRVEEFVRRVRIDWYAGRAMEEGAERLVRVSRYMGAQGDIGKLFEELKGRGFNESKTRAALAILGFASQPVGETLKRKYHKLVRQYHPDVPGGGDPEKLKAVIAAYEILKKFGDSREL